jgi:hypothetical protein
MTQLPTIRIPFMDHVNGLRLVYNEFQEEIQELTSTTHTTSNNINSVSVIQPVSCVHKSMHMRQPSPNDYKLCASLVYNKCSNYHQLHTIQNQENGLCLNQPIKLL